ATQRLGRTFGQGWILSATSPAPRLKSPPTCWTHGCPDSCARCPWITNILPPPQIERPGRRVPRAARASPTRTAACDVESAASRPASKTTGPVRIPVETVRPKLTHRSRISGREPQRNMTIPEAAAPPGDEGAQIHLRVKLLPRDRRVPVRALRAKHLGQYIAVEGLVRKSTEVRPRVTDALFQCLRCGTIIKEPQDGQTFREPLECYEEQGGCKRSASATKFKLLTETSLFVDTQKLE